MSGWAGAVAFSWAAPSYLPSTGSDKSEPVEGQRPTDSDADSAGGFAPLAEQPRYPSRPISFD